MTSFDWARIEARLDVATQVATGGPDQARALLESRAEALARPSGSAAVAGLQVVAFWVGEERFGLEVRWVLEIARRVTAARVPGAIVELLGVVSYRGRFLPVLDLRSCFGVTAEVGAEARVLVIGAEEPEVGLLVSGVDEIGDRRRADLQPVQASHTSLRRWVEGVFPDGECLLDGGALLGELDLTERGA